MKLDLLQRYYTTRFRLRIKLIILINFCIIFSYIGVHNYVYIDNRETFYYSVLFLVFTFVVARSCFKSRYNTLCELYFTLYKDNTLSKEELDSLVETINNRRVTSNLNKLKMRKGV